MVSDLRTNSEIQSNIAYLQLTDSETQSLVDESLTVVSPGFLRKVWNGLKSNGIPIVIGSLLAGAVLLKTYYLCTA